MRIDLPKNVKLIIDKLENAGYEAYAVGGCVRDSLLFREPKDWDITTNADPYEVKKLFRHTIDTGLKHGTVTVMLDGVGYEVTTYRIDGVYEDNRHPSEVRFTKELSEDLLRRDFTINAMAYNESKGLVDLFGGREDLENGIIRAVGNANERFSEDALRIMRAGRFAAELDFTIDPETEAAMGKYAENLKDVSAERIRVELQKLIMGKSPEKIEILYRTGITGVVLPEWDACVGVGQETDYHCYDVDQHILVSVKALHALLGIHPENREMDFSRNAFEKENARKNDDNKSMTDNKVIADDNKSAVYNKAKTENKSAVDNMAEGGNKVVSKGIAGLKYSELSLPDFSESFTEKEKQMLVIAMFLHDIGKPQTKSFDNGEAHFYGHTEKSAEIAKNILRRLKYDNETINTVSLLIARHDDRYVYDWKNRPERTARFVANEIGLRHMRMLLPISYADNLAHAPEKIPMVLKECERFGKWTERLSESGEAYNIKMLSLGGKDLLDAGLSAGKELGIILEELMRQVIEEPELNSKEILLDRALAFSAFGTDKLYKKLFFDLDGTLTDSAEGIIRCHEHALTEMGVPRFAWGNLHRFIGPPLQNTYPEFFDSEEDVRKAMTLYRTRYNEIGWKENLVYDGVPEMLERLHQAGYKLYVATSKPERFATRIMEFFDLTKYFDGICGASADDKISSKTEVLAYALEKAGVEFIWDEAVTGLDEDDRAQDDQVSGMEDGMVKKSVSETILSGGSIEGLKVKRPYEALMIGDRFYDAEGARPLGVRTLGVTYGFGSEKELLRAGVVKTVKTPEEVAEYLFSLL